MKAEDVTNTLQQARRDVIARGGHKPRMLSDNCSSYVSADLAQCLEENGMDHVRGTPHHLSAAENRILLKNYYLPGDLEAHMGRFVEHYNHCRYHESLKNFDPACLLRARPDHPSTTREDQTRNHPNAPLAASKEGRLSLKPDEPPTPLNHTQRSEPALTARFNPGE